MWGVLDDFILNQTTIQKRKRNLYLGSQCFSHSSQSCPCLAKKALFPSAKAIKGGREYINLFPLLPGVIWATCHFLINSYSLCLSCISAIRPNEAVNYCYVFHVLLNKWIFLGFSRHLDHPTTGYKNDKQLYYPLSTSSGQ